MKRTIVMWAMLTAIIVLPMAVFAAGGWEPIKVAPSGSSAPSQQSAPTPAPAATTGGGGLTITNADGAETGSIYIISVGRVFPCELAE